MKPNMNVAVDIVVIAGNEILLVKRKNEPFKDSWCLPGGFVDLEEDVYDAAERELEEETGIKDVPLGEMEVFGKPGRDPRGRVISVAHLCLLESKVDVTAGDDAREAEWFSLGELPTLAFDHDEIVKVALEHLDDTI